MLPRQGPLPDFTGLARPTGWCKRAHTRSNSIWIMLCELSSLEKKGKKKKDGHISLRLASFLSEHPLVSLVMGSSHELTLCSTPSSLLEEGNSPSLEVLVCVCVQWSPKMGYKAKLMS